MIYPKTLGLLVYPCTLVGYSRLGLVISAVGVHLSGQGGRWVVIGLLGLSLLLDGLDGYLARRHGHSSHFGALLDLAIDLSTHSVVWTLSGFYLAAPLLVLEWSTGLYMAAFSMLPVDSWKNILIKGGPALIRYYFSNHQRNLLSVYGNVGHFVFPAALYLQLSVAWVYTLALPGLVLYELVTFYSLYIFLRLLVEKRD
jgi:phosphatidylglycerophosphate synthase